MIINIKNKIVLKDVPRHLATEVKSRLSFENPEYLEAKKWKRYTGKFPRYLKYFEEADDGNLVIPRGFIRELLILCRDRNVKHTLADHRRALAEVDFRFKGELRPFQNRAVRDVLERDSGTLSAPTGSGKTVMALAVIAKRKQPTLIVVHSLELQNQWVSRIETFLGIPSEEIGIIGGGKKIIGDRITVALVQSLYKCSGEVSKHIGFLIVDEAHRTPARNFTEAVTAFDSKFLLGLSATPYRSDGLGRLIFWHLGGLVHSVDPKELQDNGDILKVDAVIRETDFETLLDPSSEYSAMMSELTQDYDRNNLIAADVVKEARSTSGICLVLSDRKQHCEDLQTILRGRGLRPEVLTGSVTNGNREKIVQRLNEGKIKVLIATGQLIGEGFDLPALSTLFLTTPISFRGRVTQYLGRILRPAPGKKKAKLFDYVDNLVGVLEHSAEARQRVYRGGH
jgi:superfamily II DNA or RNA helicase